ncbi:MAG: PAS domain S-box protein [Anaerolineae bacterium]|nr:PAS domain S-box protein [Anaerolineae bacterium]
MLYLFQSVWVLPHTAGIPALLSGDVGWLPGAIALLALLLFALWRWHGRTTQRLRRKMKGLEALLAERTAELQLYSRAVEQSAASIVVTDHLKRIEFVNPAFTVNTGYTAEEVIGRFPLALRTNVLPQETYRNLQETLGRGEVWTGELVSQRKDGSLLYERAIISPVRDETGQISHHVTVKDNITAQKEAEMALHRNEALFRLAFENVGIGMGLVDLEGRFVRVNRQLGMIFGYTAEELLQTSLTALLHPAYRDISPLLMQHLRNETSPLTALEQQYYHRDGHVIWGLTSSTLVRDAQGEPLYYVVYVQNITDRKQAETALRESEERFAAVLNGLQADIYVADIDTHELLFVNQQLCRDFGVIEGQHCWEVFHPGQTAPCEVCPVPRLLTPTGAAAAPLTREYQDTQTGRWYQLRYEAIPWINGRWAQLQIATDITAVKEAEQRLLEQQRQLATLAERERIGRELHDDLGQLLSYLNVQAQAVQTLLAQDKYPQAREALQQLAHAAQTAHSDLRQYLLGIRAGQAPAPTTVTFLEALQQYLDELQHTYAFQVELNLPEEDLTSALTPEVEGQLLRIIQEALANTRKHSGVRQARLSFDLDPQYVEAIVEDRGRGFNLDQPSEKAAEAAPLAEVHFGLQIMAERAAKVSGSVHLHSQPGQGAQVIIRVPRALVTSPSNKTALSPMRVLLADDHQLFVEGLRTLLVARGVQVVGVAHNGLEAQVQARVLAPDVILMDVNMPLCDGIEATRRIKAELPAVKIVMLTMAADDDTLFAALQAGASGYLLKSLQGDEFQRLLQELARGEAVLAPGLAQRVLRTFTQRAAPSPAEAAAPIPELTAQQQGILDLVAQGLTYKEVGVRLHLTERTIRYHMEQILQRLQLESKREAIAYARRQGLGIQE